MKNYTKSEIEKIVRDEIKSYIKDQIDDEISKAVKKAGGKSRKEVIEIAKEAVSKLAEFLWVRRNVWKGDIR